ncbi:ATP-binding protein [Thalassospiraceae bacterium SW-3-3]|nr:ATP-binding protein [Thalassospiraceae bacterium SW-3-3]
MFKVTARTVLELGSELISSDVIAFYELIKNGFDASTENGVEICFDVVLGLRSYSSLRNRAKEREVPLETLKQRCISELDVAAKKLYGRALELISSAESYDGLSAALAKVYSLNSIRVIDTGTGMSAADLEEKFLVIGTPSRKIAVEKSVLEGKEKPDFLGEKGLGRLSAMRLGGTLTIETARRKDTELNHLKIDWRAFEDVTKMIEDIDVKAYTSGAKPSTTYSGTVLTISELSADWNEGRVKLLASTDFAFLTNPLADSKDRPRIALIWNGERIAIPLLGKKFLELSHASIWGDYNVGEGGPKLTLHVRLRDLGFEHPVVEEKLRFGEADLYAMIRGRDEAIPEDALVDLGSFKFEAHWYNRRRVKAEGGMDRDQILKLHRQWAGIRMYRDDFRVYPYGQEKDDWLGLDREALMARGYLLNKIQLVGQVEVSRSVNPGLVDQTNREGLRETHEQQAMLRIVQFSIQDQLRSTMKRAETKYKPKRAKPVKAKTEIARLEDRAKKAIRSLRSATTNQERETIEELQQTLLELTELAKILRERNAEVEGDAKLMQDMAGIGLLVEIVAHELARTSEHALERIRELQSTAKSDEVVTGLDGLAASMKSIHKRLRILDPLSVSGRQASETFSLTQLICEALEDHESQFLRHGIHLKFDPPKDRFMTKTVKGYVVQIFENLLANSVYWLSLEKEKSPLFEPEIAVEIVDSPLRIIFSDNGPGIDPEHKDRIFEMFFSLKESKKRRGLGLYIAKANAFAAGGSLELQEEPQNAFGRLNTFEYCISERM